MEHSLERFDKETFKFPGNYRGIVEDNEDPLGSGRVKVRILGIHSPDGTLTPIEHLPWAEPCLSLYYSGGQNLECKSAKSTNRYTPDNSSFTPLPRDTKDYQETFVDTIMKNDGTGGFFTVPRKGSMVWVFFEAENHNRPHYWGAAPKRADWIKQRKKTINDVKRKIIEIDEMRSRFTPNIGYHQGSGCTSSAAVRTPTNQPRMKVQSLDNIENFHISSFTSIGGVTYIIVNKDGLERTYIIHKGYMEYTDENGQRKVLVGQTNNQGNDFEHLIANNYELHVDGDFKIFTNQSCFIQVEGDAQINVRQNVGVVSREGDIDLVSTKGNVNIEAGNNINIHAKGNIQQQTGEDMIIKVDGDSNTYIKGSYLKIVNKDINLKSLNYNLTVGMSTSLKTTLNTSIQSGTIMALKSNILGADSNVLTLRGQASANLDGGIIHLASGLVNVGGMALLGSASAGNPPQVTDPTVPTQSPFILPGTLKNAVANKPAFN